MHARFCALAIGVFILTACTPKKDATEKKSASDAGGVHFDSLVRDDMPVKMMADTVRPTVARPIVVPDRSSGDSLMIFPYTLIFESPGFNTYLVSYRDYSPTLVTLDANEKIIDSVTLLHYIPAKTPEHRRSEYLQISSLTDIVVTDSIFERLDRSSSMKVRKRKYAVTAKGTIAKLP